MLSYVGRGFSRAAWRRAVRNDRAFIQLLLDTLKLERPAYCDLHACAIVHGWPA
jgi:hypothetical protein